MELQLSDKQQKAIGAALTLLAAFVILGTILGLGWLLALFLGRFSSVLMPLAVAAVISLVASPFYSWLREKLRLPTPLALLAFFLAFLIPLGLFLVFFGSLLVDQAATLIDKLPEFRDDVVTWAQGQWPQVREFLEENVWGQRLKEAAQGQQDAVMDGVESLARSALGAGGAVMEAVGGALGWAVMPVYLIFFLIADTSAIGKIGPHLPFLKPGTREDVQYLVTEFIEIVVAFFRGQLIIAFLQGVLYAIGFAVIGLKYGFVLGLMLGFLNIIPYLGAMVGLAVTVPLAYLQEGGGVGLVALVLAVIALVQLIEGYLLTPRIMGDRTGLHPLTIIVAIFFWGSALGGILGMILAIPLTAFLVVFWRLAKEKYIPELI